jgi:toxin FitB
MNLVDSCGWLEYFAEGSGASFFAPIIDDPANLLISTICTYEVYKRTVRQGGRKAGLRVVALMRLGRVIDVNEEIALAAAEISHETKLAMADSLLLATARAYDAVFWTQDAHFRGMPGVRFREALSTND